MSFTAFSVNYAVKQNGHGHTNQRGSHHRGSDIKRSVDIVHLLYILCILCISPHCFYSPNKLKRSVHLKEKTTTNNVEKGVMAQALCRWGLQSACAAAGVPRCAALGDDALDIFECNGSLQTCRPTPGSAGTLAVNERGTHDEWNSEKNAITTKRRSSLLFLVFLWVPKDTNHLPKHSADREHS